MVIMYGSVLLGKTGDILPTCKYSYFRYIMDTVIAHCRVSVLEKNDSALGISLIGRQVVECAHAECASPGPLGIAIFQ
jgi:hypothetical protein